MTGPTNVVAGLIRIGVPIAKLVARFLAECEHLLSIDSDDPTSSLNPSLTTPPELLARISPAWKEDAGASLSAAMSFVQWLDDDRGWWTPARFSDRLAGVVLHSWTQRVSRSGRRPDVLHLTSVLLANPAIPHTFHTSRFAIVLALRSLYRIKNDNAEIDQLRRVYRRLESRFGEQQRRRVAKTAKGAEPFLIDLLCMGRGVHRAIVGDNLREYYAGFAKWPLGVNTDLAQRCFSETGDWPEIHGHLPGFSSLLNLAYNQPTGVPGIDEVTGGLMGSVAGTSPRSTFGGVVTLVAGAPGSGKTTVCMSISSRMAELGSTVVYLTTEEEGHRLDAKRLAVVDDTYLVDAFWPGGTTNGFVNTFEIQEGRSFLSLQDISDRIVDDVGNPAAGDDVPGHVYMSFRYVLVIDSISLLLMDGGRRSSGDQLQHDADEPDLAGVLNRLRNCGVCVFLVGEKEHLLDQRLTYLVDNVFLLDLEDEESHRHPIRVFSIEKTRLQASHRGRHVFHLSRSRGPSVSPSLHSVLRTAGVATGERKFDRRAILWARVPNQPILPGLLDEIGIADQGEVITVRQGSHTLIYGWGSSGKAKLAMALALEPRYPVSPAGDWMRHVQGRSAKVPELATRETTEDEIGSDRNYVMRSRVLVISFLYNRSYYNDLVKSIAAQRYGIAAPVVDDLYETLDLYPGYLDPETLLARTRTALQGARLEGRPYTAVVVDGIHNMLLQFPLLARERLLWPTLFRVLRSECCDAVSTFTFFRAAAGMPDSGTAFEEVDMVPDDAQRMFYHLLVSSCDYSFLVRKNQAGAGDRFLSLTRTSTIAGVGKERDRLTWDSVRNRFRVD